MEKFIQNSFSLRRVSPKPIINNKSGLVLRRQEERLIIEIEYIGVGDTTTITDSQIFDILKQSLLEEIKL